MRKLTVAGAFIIIYQILLAISLPFYFYYAPPRLNMIITSIILFFVSGMAVTAGYHRYYSHRAYQPSKMTEAILLFIASMAMQGSALRWAFNHRMHHRFTEKEQDPHSIKKGFWYAHMLWLFDEEKPIDEKVIPDLVQNKLIQFQHKHYPVLAVMTNVLAFALVGWLLNDFIGAFFLSWWTRLFFLHHMTWFINSLAHTWGAKTYSREQTAVDNYLIALLTFGEGYHNYHHVFSSDYRNGIKWYHFDPSKWLIWTLSKLGLAYNLTRINKYTITRRIIQEDKNLLLERIRQRMHDRKEALEQRVHQLSESLTAKLTEMSARLHEYEELKKNRAKERIAELRLQIKQLKKNFKQDWNAWLRLSQGIIND